MAGGQVERLKPLVFLRGVFEPARIRSMQPETHTVGRISKRRARLIDGDIGHSVEGLTRGWIIPTLAWSITDISKTLRAIPSRRRIKQERITQERNKKNRIQDGI